MKNNWKELLISVLIPVGLGIIVGLITKSGYGDIVKPDFAPPAILFPIVWTILYTLMGVSSYLIKENGGKLNIYYLQLAVNLIWPFIFFSLKWYLVSFIWLLLLIVLVISMIKKFYETNKLSGLIQIPYLIWITFAAILNFTIYTLN